MVAGTIAMLLELRMLVPLAFWYHLTRPPAICVTEAIFVGSSVDRPIVTAYLKTVAKRDGLK